METRVLRTRGEEFADILHPVLAGMFRQIIIPGGPLNLLPEHRRYRRAVAALHRIVDELIAERRAQPDPGEDLLGILLTTSGDDGRALTDREVRDNIIAMLTAGIETVGTATEWALWLLAHDSEQQDRVRAEVAALGRLPEPEDLPSLRHTGNVLTESLRVHSAVWMLNRIAVADIDLAGYRIPEGADILWCPYVLHRDRRQFDHPEIFDPDRWLPDRAATVPRHALMPFAVGSRKCPADDYSVSEITALIATIAARWRLVDTDHTDPTPHPRITAHPKQLLLQVRPLTSPASG
jgi:epi-isozizaene 5-monooxygenase